LPIVPHIFDIFANKWCWLQFDGGEDLVQKFGVKRLKNENKTNKILILLSASQPFLIGENLLNRKKFKNAKMK
jgi:hypothetical protein